ncbi:hypothetical protein GGS23DRAFT_577566 [Durotheca rogersii]|uniref:uncharacterized protein n=1 Tax=Durotheca rogersii TaxID=419775 RepID=UPI00221E56B7|nr:uncharacterized protein GGS23DRAFT_577566 [Durotheca rogersii]KAI5861203.1 hypothetical protein GGS23DRAFT_577566 [Durotheca rogersii]
MTDSPSILNRKRRAISDAPDPLEATTKWLDDLLEQRTRQGCRIISPATEANVRAILAKFQRAQEAPSGEQQNILAAESLASIRRVIDRRLAIDAKYADARLKLEKLERDAWLLRYGDYHAAALGALRGEARKIAQKAKRHQKKVQKKQEALEAQMIADGNSAGASVSIAPSTTPTTQPESGDDAVLVEFLSQSWATIDQTLAREEADAENCFESEPPTQPMTQLVTKLTNLLPLTTIYRDVRESIALYAKRNELAHGHIAKLAESGKFFELAGKLNADLINVICKPGVPAAERRSTESAIMVVVNKYFEEFKRDPETNALLTFRVRPTADSKVKSGDDRSRQKTLRG